MVRLALALLFAALSAACAAPNPGATPAPDSNPASPPNAGANQLRTSTEPGENTYSQCHVEGPYIAMTFDDGPHAQNTPRLLEMLKQRGIKATFFVVGQCAAEYPAIMKRIVEEGHEIANHSWSHPQLSRMGEGSVTSELQRTHDVIEQTTGVTPTLMRPPFGAFTTNQRTWASHKWGYRIILWDVDPLDWKYHNAEHVKNEILKSTVNGSIILSHDIHKTTIDAMPETLDGLAAKGFKFVTVSELLAMDRPVSPKPKATPAPKTPDLVEQPEPKITSATPAPALKAAAPPSKAAGRSRK